MKSDSRFPLPWEQYRWYVLVFHALTLGGLLVALVLVVWNARGALGWREGLVIVLLLLQMGLYLRVMVMAREWPVFRQRLLWYFALNLAVWLVEYWLVPDVYWIIFPYIGQMFGLLPARFGVVATAFVSFIIFINSAGWRLSEASPGLFLATLGLWGSIIILLLYLNHLIQTSQERGWLIAELERTQKELEIAQQRQAELAVLRERERLARDLHDSLGHTLVALSVQLEAIQRLYRVDPERASAQVEETKALARTSMDALRRSLAGLRTPGLGERTLGPALQALCVDFAQRTGVEIDCRIDGSVGELRPAVAEALWRLTQEALTNVEKHAQAHEVQVLLARHPGSVILRVVDDGIGLKEEDLSSPNCFGVRGMRERVEGLGGRLTLQGGEVGTLVEASLPIIGNGSGAPSLHGREGTES